MSGWLHPVGPEPVRVYWARRAIVLAVFLVVVAAIIALAVNATSGQPPVAAVPATSSSVVTPSPSVLPTSPTPSATMSASGSSPSMSPTPSGRASKPSSTPTATVTPARCDPAELRTTLTGSQRLQPQDHSTFSLSVINGGPATCRLNVTPATFELKIYSGLDRIWSSSDCSTAVRPLTGNVASEKSVSWTMTWNGRRSAKACKSRAAVPRAGTYVATAQLAGAKPVQLRMILR